MANKIPLLWWLVMEGSRYHQWFDFQGFYLNQFSLFFGRNKARRFRIKIPQFLFFATIEEICTRKSKCGNRQELGIILFRGSPRGIVPLPLPLEKFWPFPLAICHGGLISINFSEGEGIRGFLETPKKNNPQFLILDHYLKYLKTSLVLPKMYREYQRG